MNQNPHFASVGSWDDAESMLCFRPRKPLSTAGHELESLSVYVGDHKMRELGLASRTLEAHFGAFVLSQSRPGEPEARRRALRVAYGAEARTAIVAGREGRLYELGPEPPPDDIDPRSPAVVVWHDGGMLYLIASEELSAEELLGIGVSMYSGDERSSADEPRRAGR